MGYSKKEISAVLSESEQARKHRQKLAKVTETVAPYRLREMKNFQAREQLATWRRTRGFDRDDSWVHGTLPLSPKEPTQSLWSEVNALKYAISMPFRARPWQKTMEFVDGLEGDLPDEELAAIKRYVERRSREAAQVTVPPVSTAHHCITRSLNPETPSHVYVNMEEKEEGRMNPELTELEPPSTGTGLETPGQQSPSNEGTWEKGRTIADGYLLVGMGSNRGGDISSPTEHVGTRAATAATPAKPREKTTSEENKQFDPGGKGKTAPLWNAAVILFSFSWGELWAMGGSLVLLRVLCLCVPVCLFAIYCSFQVTIVQRAEKHERRRGSSP